MNLDNRFPFELALQRTILKVMFKNETFFLKCMSHLKSEYFENQYLSWLYKLIVSYYKEYKTLPSMETVRNEILKFEVKDRILYEKVYDDILATDYKDLEYLYHELTGFAKRAYFVDNIKRTLSLYNEGNRNNAYRHMKEFSQSLSEIDFEESDLFDYSNLFPLLEGLRSPKFRMPLSIKPFDEVMAGGMPKGRLMLILAGVSQGKSMVLTNLGKNFIQKDKKVLFITLENPEDEQITRFLSPMTDISQDDFNKRELTDDEKVKVIMAKEKMEKNLFLKSWYEDSLTIEHIVNYCKVRHAMDPYDVLIIDYVQLIKQRASERMRDLWAIQGDIVKGLQNLARNLNICVISAAQINRSAMQKTRKSKGFKDLTRMTDVGESYNQVKIADIVLTLTVSDADYKNSVMRMLLDKHRGGEKGILVEVEVDFPTQKIFSPDLRCRKLKWSDALNPSGNRDPKDLDEEPESEESGTDNVKVSEAEIEKLLS